MADKTQLRSGLVPDSSVVIKWFSEEENTDEALEIRENHINGSVELAVPDLLLYEVANALRYNKTVTEEDVKAAVDSLLKLGINIIIPTKEVMDLAIMFAFKFDITLYDAYFLALGEKLQFTCVTADEKLYNKTKSFPFVKLLKGMF